MHKGEVRDIQEILDGARAAGVVGIGAAVDFMESGIVPLRKFWHAAFWIAQRDPDPIVLLLCRVDLCVRRGGRFLSGVCRETHALAFLVICPAVVRTNEAI